MRTSGYFSSVASVLTSLARRYGMETKLLEHRLAQRWGEIAGDQIAAHTRPDQIRFKKLYLIVENSVWLQQLLFLKPELIEKVNAVAGSRLVTDIVLRVGEVGGQSRSATSDIQREEDAAGPAPEALAQATSYAAGIKDPELRARLAQVVAKALAPRSRPFGRPDPVARPKRGRSA